jgi:hypothetical protein
MSIWGISANQTQSIKTNSKSNTTYKTKRFKLRDIVIEKEAIKRARERGRAT